MNTSNLMILGGILALSACSTISHIPPPSDFPVLKEIVHIVSTREKNDVCAKYGPPFTYVEACAEWYFETRECHIWLDKDFLQEYQIEHERMHCKGYDHPGSTVIFDSWNVWKNRKNK